MKLSVYNIYTQDETFVLRICFNPSGKNLTYYIGEQNRIQLAQQVFPAFAAERMTLTSLFDIQVAKGG